MDWTFAYVLGGVALNALILGVWKPWVAAYTWEKAKNFARKEDLDAILAEVRAVTITQKEIESNLSGDLWNRQMHWNQKRDVYAELIRVGITFTSIYVGLNVIMKGLSDGYTQSEVGPLILERDKFLHRLHEAHLEYARLFSVACIFANMRCQAALGQFITQTALPVAMTNERASQLQAETSNLIAELVMAAKEDLGIAVLST
jgi:hypothetical protein